MVNCSADILLCVPVPNCSTGNDHVQHGMHILNAGFLIVPHGITIEEDCPSGFTAVMFEMVRLSEFYVPVGEDHGKEERKVKGN